MIKYPKEKWIERSDKVINNTLLKLRSNSKTLDIKMSISYSHCINWKDLDHMWKVQCVRRGQYQARKYISVAGSADADADTTNLEPVSARISFWAAQKDILALVIDEYESNSL